ncbi:MAG: AMP-binding protein, partial [Alphaproteobacteria bacterium]
MSIEATETIGEIVRRHARETPDAAALMSEDQNPLTYRGLASVMDRIQASLNAAGFGRGDRVATVGRSDAANAALVVGIWSCAAAVPMNPALSADEFAAYLRELKVQGVAVDATMDTPARAAAQEAGLPLLEVEATDHRVAGMIDIRPGAPAGTPASPDPAQLDDLGVVMLTSGTTSRSKVVPVPHRHLSIKAGRFARALELAPSDRCLNLMPMFHVHGLYCALGGTLVGGGSLISLPEFS